MPPPFPQPKGIFSGAEGRGYSVVRRGRGIIFGTDPFGVWLWTELATSCLESLESLDTFYVHIT